MTNFSDIDPYPFLAPIRDNFDVILDEYRRIPGAVPWHETAIYDKGWDVFGFHMNGLDIEAGKTYCPKTFALVKAVPGLFIAGFSILRPGCHIHPHQGYTKRVLRSHLGLDCRGGAWIEVGGERKEWKEGEMFVFDDTIMHSAANEGDAPRGILIVDFERPN